MGWCRKHTSSWQAGGTWWDMLCILPHLVCVCVCIRIHFFKVCAFGLKPPTCPSDSGLSFFFNFSSFLGGQLVLCSSCHIYRSNSSITCPLLFTHYHAIFTFMCLKRTTRRLKSPQLKTPAASGPPPGPLDLWSLRRCHTSPNSFHSVCGTRG